MKRLILMGVLGLPFLSFSQEVRSDTFKIDTTKYEVYDIRGEEIYNLMNGRADTLKTYNGSLYVRYKGVIKEIKLEDDGQEQL